MTTTELSLGLNPNSRPSSRVLKPPGGGHTSLFGDPEVKPNKPRASYNQQNSSNLNQCMNTTDPNISVQQLCEETAAKPEVAKETAAQSAAEKTSPNSAPSSNEPAAPARGRVPPGGFSSGGFW
ncbi:unnamed protein product [Hermetia illucens]|uniref:Microtubule-associated protein Jupiter n=2 Tax=Hermetia illucens TaxID=343691 RepID=A0A7R8V504_HERIL|nr:jupiter microtubule associated homolog 1 isoform X2 [Hermetia illucens]CAD7092960.1 unnamed protein product [Hermetia illucens]